MSDVASAAGGGVSDHPTAGRWCKGCCDFLPLDNFPKGKRRYMCSKHARPSNARAIREKMFGKNPRKKAVWRIWHYAYLDSREVWRGQNKVADPGRHCRPVRSPRP